MRLAITGISGYLARSLFPLLDADPCIEEIRGLDLKEPPFRSAKLHFLRADVRDSDLSRHLKGCDTLIHLAFVVMPIRDETLADDININGSRNVLRAASAAGLRKIVYTSSVAAYGAWPDNPDVITEETMVRGMPTFYYSRAKAAVELILDEFEKEHPRLVITRFRPCIFVGPTIEIAFFKNLVDRKILPRFIGHDARLQLAWDEDIARAIHLALGDDFPGAFNLAGDGAMSFPEMAEIMGAWCLPLLYPVAYWGSKFFGALGLLGQLSTGWIEILRYPIVVSSEKAKRVLGWKPTCDTVGAFRRLLDILRDL